MLNNSFHHTICLNVVPISYLRPKFPSTKVSMSIKTLIRAWIWLNRSACIISRETIRLKVWQTNSYRKSCKLRVRINLQGSQLNKNFLIKSTCPSILSIKIQKPIKPKLCMVNKISTCSLKELSITTWAVMVRFKTRTLGYAKMVALLNQVDLCPTIWCSNSNIKMLFRRTAKTTRCWCSSHFFLRNNSIQTSRLI